jgi:hypothetical protein
VLQLLTAEHGHASYFINADISFADGFFGVDMKVEGPKWREREQKAHVPPQIDRVPICVVVYG